MNAVHHVWQALPAIVPHVLQNQSGISISMSLFCRYQHYFHLIALTACKQVDVDLGLAGCAKRVSRQQATLTLQADGRFCMRNIGRRSFFVNSLQVCWFVCHLSYPPTSCTHSHGLPASILAFR